MEDNIVKEKLSEAFFNLVMAKNRYKVYETKSGDDGVDLTIGPLIQYTSVTGAKSWIDSPKRLDIQLKCTTESGITRKNNGDVVYNLRIKNYEDLIVRRDLEGYFKMLLVLFILPDDESEWFHVLEDKATLAKHAFWFYPSNEYTLDKIKITSSKNSTTTIKLLAINKLDTNFIKIYTQFHAV